MALENLPENPRILDVGAGTGAIGLALLKELPNAKCVAIDINPKAVQLATKNALSVGVNERYEVLNMSLQEYHFSGLGSCMFDIVVSNPPYIPSVEMLTLEPEVKQYEDPLALHGGKDGLDIARQLLEYTPSFLKSAEESFGEGEGEVKCRPFREVFLELAWQHPPLLENELHGADGKALAPWEIVEGIQDLSGRPRFVRLKLA